MARTTIDIDPVVLRALKQRQRREGKTLGRLVSELLTNALSREVPPSQVPLRWRSQAMRPLVDLEDKEAVRRALDAG